MFNILTSNFIGMILTIFRVILPNFMRLRYGELKLRIPIKSEQYIEIVQFVGLIYTHKNSQKYASPIPPMHVAC